MNKSKKNPHWKEIRGVLDYAIKYVKADSHWGELKDDGDYLLVINYLVKAYRVASEKKKK